MKKTIRIVFILSCTFIIFSTYCLAENYFPLIPDTLYTYKVFFGGNEFLEEIKVMEFNQDGIHGYYFVPTDIKKQKHAGIADTMFGLGAYSLENNVLYTISASIDKNKKVTMLSQKQTLLASPVKVGDKREIKAPFFKGKVVLSVVGFESLRAPAGLFNNCVKIKLEYIGPDKTDQEFIWLADNVGMLKWQRKTGRIDELVLVKFPK